MNKRAEQIIEYYASCGVSPKQLGRVLLEQKQEKAARDGLLQDTVANVLGGVIPDAAGKTSKGLKDLALAPIIAPILLGGGIGLAGGTTYYGLTKRDQDQKKRDILAERERQELRQAINKLRKLQAKGVKAPGTQVSIA